MHSKKTDKFVCFFVIQGVIDSKNTGLIAA